METGGAGEAECDAGWEGAGDGFAGAGAGAGAGLELPMLREMVWGGPRLKGFPGTNSNAPALSLLMVVGSLDCGVYPFPYISLIS